MKRILLSLALWLIGLAVLGQTVDYWCKDGRIYFKVNDNVQLNINSTDGIVNPKDVYFLESIRQEYQITDLRLPFITAKSDVLQRTFRMDFENIHEVDNLVRQMNQLPEIEYAEKAPLFRISLVPDDPYYGEVVGSGFGGGTADAHWHLNLINAEQAWDITTGDSEIVVAILDNAIYVDHPDLQNKIVEQVDLGNGDDDPNPPEDTYIWSHGTHGAGLIAAETNNAVGVASIGYDVSIMAVKLGDDASDGQAMAAGFEGIVWAADNGADVINMSWGSPQFFQTMQNTVNYAYNQGCVLVGAAGNNGNGMETMMDSTIPVNYVGYPAALDHVIAVGSCDVGDNKSDFSNYGTWLDVLAPGGYYDQGIMGMGAFTVLSTTMSEAGDIWSTLSGTGGGAASYGVEGQYDVMQGTSMAAPVTSGLCGLMLSANPDITPEELTNLLKTTCDNVDAENPDIVDSIGAGRINAAAAVQGAMDAIAPIVADFEASETTIAVDGSVDFTDLSTGTPTSWEWTFEGGTPQTSQDPNPTGITYSEDGVYEVSLTVSDGTDSDTETKTAFIIVGQGSGGAETAWIEQHTHFESQFRGVIYTDIVDDTTAWILTYDGTGGSVTRDFARTADGGEPWIPDTIIAPDNLAPGCISAVSDMEAWVVLYDVNGGGAVYHTEDGGNTWTEQPSAAFDNAASFPNVIHMFNEDEGFCQGDPVDGEFEIYLTSDGGENWTLADGANLPDAESGEMGWTGVFDAVGNTAWFGTNTGRIFKTADKGLTWEAYASSEDNVSRITMTNADEGFLIAEVRNQQTGAVESWAMRKTTDGGENWDAISVAPENQPSDISAVPGQPGMLVSVCISQTLEDNFSAYSTDYGTSWTHLDDSVQYTNVQMLNDSIGWAGGFNMDENTGGIYKWDGIPGMTDPYFTSSPVIEVFMGEEYSYSITAVDPQDLPITITAPSLPAWLELTDNGDGTALLTGTAPMITTLSEDYNVLLEVDNGENTGEQSFVITVNTTNEAPEFTSDPITTAQVNVLYTYELTADDPDDDDLSFSLESTQEWLGLEDHGDGTATLSGTPDTESSLGLTIELSLTDGLYEDTQVYSLIVNSIEDFGNGLVELYPNPSNGNFFITNAQGVNYEIYSLDGRLIQNGQCEESREYIEIDAANGMYFMRLSKDHQSSSVKIQILK